jgi:hypothetical protein
MVPIRNLSARPLIAPGTGRHCACTTAGAGQRDVSGPSLPSPGGS